MKRMLRAVISRTYLSSVILGALVATVLSSPTAWALDYTTKSGADAARGADQPIDLVGNGGIFSTITDILLYILGAVSVIMIIIGGLRYVISGGNSTAITAAKNTILYAIIGLVVAVLAYAIIDFVLAGLHPGSSGSTTGGAV